MKRGLFLQIRIWLRRICASEYNRLARFFDRRRSASAAVCALCGSLTAAYAGQFALPAAVFVLALAALCIIGKRRKLACALLILCAFTGWYTIKDAAVPDIEVLAHTLNTPALAAKLLSDIASPALQIVLDPINLLSPENIERQRYIIDECFDLFSDRIVAVHAKDVVMENGAFRRCVIGDGIFDHEYFYKKLNRAKPGICVLREEAHPETAKRDIEALKRYSLL